MIDVDEELAHQGVGVVAIRQFADQEIAELTFVTTIGQGVFVTPLTFQRCGVSVQHARATNQVERGVGHRDVFFEERTVSAPFRQSLPQDQRVVAEPLHVFEVWLTHSFKSSGTS